VETSWYQRFDPIPARARNLPIVFSRFPKGSVPFGGDIDARPTATGGAGKDGPVPLQPSEGWQGPGWVQKVGEKTQLAARCEPGVPEEPSYPTLPWPKDQVGWLLSGTAPSCMGCMGPCHGFPC